MNINDAIKSPIINAILYFMLCSTSIVALAETGHEAEEESGEGHIELTQEQIEHGGITLAKVESGAIRETLPLYGVIVSNAEQTQSVSARFEGVIRSVNKRVGDLVRKGEVLATVEADESLKVYSVLSSRNGVITQRNANVGEQTAGRALFVIENFSTVWVELSLFPKDVAKAELGQKVRITNASHPATGEGEIIYIDPLGNSNNQATTARVFLNNTDNLWKPGFFVNAEIILSETTASTVIKTEAVQLVEGKAVVFVKGEEGFEPREIILGRTDGEYAEVLSGLKNGETYVAGNSFVLKSEMGKGEAAHGH